MKINSALSPAYAWSDGACSGNPGPGGYGAIIQVEGIDEIILDGGETLTTNNRMELSAAISAIEKAPADRKLILTVDSEYVKNGATKWMKGWKHNGWRTKTGAEVKNQDLWERMDAALAQRGTVEWLWVRGHTGNPMNERVDRIAVAAKNRFHNILRNGRAA